MSRQCFAVTIVTLAVSVSGARASVPAAPPAPAALVQVVEAPPVFAVGPTFANQSIRENFVIPIAARRLVLRLSNEAGRAPLVIGEMRLARPGREAGSIERGSDQRLTFGGAGAITLQPGAVVFTDAVTFPVKAGQPVTVSLFLRRNTDAVASHPLGLTTAYISSQGNHCADVRFTAPETATETYFVSGILAEPVTPMQGIVALGDSITDGYRSTPDAQRRWTDILNRRLATAGLPSVVVNAGISGNRLLHDVPEEQFGPAALARFDRDVASVAGVHTLIVLEGINDIGQAAQAGLNEQAVSAEDLIGAYRQIIARARALGMRVLIGTLLPFKGTIYSGYYTDAAEHKRVAVNQWIREGGESDGIIDFDAVMRDPADPRRLLPRYDSGDHIHPNDDGYAAMASVVPLPLLSTRRP